MLRDVSSAHFVHRNIVNSVVKQLIVNVKCTAFGAFDEPAAALPDQVVIACGVPWPGSVCGAAFPANYLAAEQSDSAIASRNIKTRLQPLLHIINSFGLMMGSWSSFT